MSDHRGFERAMHDWLEAGSDRTPPRAIDAVLLAVKTTPQERDLRIPRRFTQMALSIRLVAAVAIVAVAGVAAMTLFNRSPDQGVGAVPTPAKTALPTPTAAPSPTQIDPTSWTPFTSPRNGTSFRVPTGWTIQAATAPWVWQPNDTGPTSAATDQAISPSRQAFVVASQRIPSGMSGDEWWANYLGGDTSGMPAECFPPSRSDYQVVTVDGQSAYVHGGPGDCNFLEAIVLVGGRAYQLTDYTNLDRVVGGVSDRRLFDAWLSTVTFDPAGADDTPAASPSAAP